MGRCQCLSQRSVQQVEVDRDDESADDDSGADPRSERGKSDDAGDQKQKPVGVGDKSEDTLLRFHSRTFTGSKNFSVF